MLKFTGSPVGRYCDGVSRRDFLQVGAMAMGGLTLADLLRAEAMGATRSRPRSVINIYLSGGPSHMDTFDLKPEAPAEFRGLFSPIATKAPGVDICEHLPQLANVGDKLVVVRSVADLSNEHSPRQSDSGFSESSLRMMGGRPSIGSVVTKLQGGSSNTPIAAVDLTGFTNHGYLGPSTRAYRPDGEGRENLRLKSNLSEQRLYERRDLLGSLDRLRSQIDATGGMTAVDTFSQRALDMVISGKIAQALDYDKEERAIQEMYGLTEARTGGSTNRNFLLARRLVEAGVRVVSFSWGGWDTHSDNFKSLGRQLPMLDIGLSGLIRDLDQRGLLEDTIIMMSGEFGRTPRVNMGAGRDHWPSAGFVMLAGGGFRTGQVIGSTNRLGERPQDRPLHLQQVFSAIYRQLGIDVDHTTLTDAAGRPQYIADHREPIAGLV